MKWSPKSKRVDHPNNEITTKNNVPSNNEKILKTTFISPSVVFFLNVFWISTAASSSDTEYFILRRTGAESSPVYTLYPPTYKTNKQKPSNALLLHETTRSDDFWRNTALQHCCEIISNDYNIVPTLRIVPCNITLRRGVELGTSEKQIQQAARAKLEPVTTWLWVRRTTTRPRSLNKQD